jgi:hypothetical protein
MDRFAQAEVGAVQRYIGHDHARYARWRPYTSRRFHLDAMLRTSKDSGIVEHFAGR